MTREEFNKAIIEKFGFQEFPVGWGYEKEDYGLAAVGPNYIMEYDEGEGGERKPRLDVRDDQKATLEIEILSEIEVVDPDTYFKACALCDSNGEEFVLIQEPGKWFDHVFINFHDEGLYSLDTIEDDIDRDLSDKTKDQRIEVMPFFQNPVATSLQEFFDSIVELPEDEI